MISPLYPKVIVAIFNFMAKAGYICLIILIIQPFISRINVKMDLKNPRSKLNREKDETVRSQEIYRRTRIYPIKIWNIDPTNRNEIDIIASKVIAVLLVIFMAMALLNGLLWLISLF